jgi:hypothetical protein
MKEPGSFENDSNAFLAPKASTSSGKAFTQFIRPRTSLQSPNTFLAPKAPTAVLTGYKKINPNNVLDPRQGSLSDPHDQLLALAASVGLPRNGKSHLSRNTFSETFVLEAPPPPVRNASSSSDEDNGLPIRHVVIDSPERYVTPAPGQKNSSKIIENVLAPKTSVVQPPPPPRTG